MNVADLDLPIGKSLRQDGGDIELYKQRGQPAIALYLVIRGANTPKPSKSVPRSFVVETKWGIGPSDRVAVPKPVSPPLAT